VVLTVVLTHQPKSETKTLVGVIEPMQHVAVSDITNGIRAGLASKEFTVVVANANGEKTAIPQIIANFKDQGVQVYVPIFTGTTQTVLSSVSDKPIVFAAVTDPVAARLLQNPNHPEGHVTGVSDLWPIASQLDLIRTILPRARIIGVVQDPGDPSSAVTLPILQKEAAARGFQVLVKPIHDTSEIGQSLAGMSGMVDLIYTANDVTVTAVLPAIVSFCIQHKIPFFAGDYSSVERGAIASIGQNYYTVGLSTANLVKAIRQGKKVSALPIAYTIGGDIYVNRQAAKLMGVDLPHQVIAQAKQVYDVISEKPSK
jgi:putative ABC transport system substrate-binding protein